MRIDWIDLGQHRADAADGEWIDVEGWPATVEPVERASYFLLSPEPICCRGCLPGDPLFCIEVFAGRPISLVSGAVHLRGRWRVSPEDPVGWRYQLHDASLVASARPGLTRRGLLAAGPLLCLPIAAAAQDAPQSGAPLTGSQAANSAPMASTGPTVDIHSHAGSLLHTRHDGDPAPFSPLAEPMKQGGLAVVCLAIVADQATLRVTADRRIRAIREPEPGELYSNAQRSFERLHDLAREQGLAIVADAASLRAPRAASPSVIVSSEGADFLEGQIDRLDEAFARWGLRHLQLTHYRVNELGDIQTEAPVHGGLTPFGAEVIRRCAKLGIVVDVAHGTYDLVKQAAAVAAKPLVLSHTSLTDNPTPRSRRISADHARVIAATGGIIGIWPPISIFPDLAALADGVARMADVVGPDHVGLGTDMLGLVVASALPDYARLPQFAEALRGRFSAEETAKILGGNYERVFLASLA